MPGSTGKMDPRPDHGEESYKGSGKLKGLKAIITGADSGIGRAIAIAYARDGADVLIAYLSENDDAQEVKALVEKEGRKAVLVSGDIRFRSTAGRSSSAPSTNSAESISSSTTPRIRRPSRTSATSATRSGR
jgi:hypothetical protein